MAFYSKKICLYILEKLKKAKGQGWEFISVETRSLKDLGKWMKKSKDIKLLAMAIIEESLGKIKGIAKGNTFGKMDSRILENGKMDLNRA